MNVYTYTIEFDDGSETQSDKWWISEEAARVAAAEALVEVIDADSHPWTAVEWSDHGQGYLPGYVMILRINRLEEGV